MTQNTIQVKFIQTSRTIVALRNQGAINISIGQSGNLKNHASLDNLGYENSGHTDFQKKLIYIENYKAFEIE